MRQTFDNNGATPMGIRMYSEEGSTRIARWGTADNRYFAELLSCHRGGCLYCSEIKVWEPKTGRSKSIASTMGIHDVDDAQRDTLTRYMWSMVQKHLGA